MLYYFILCASFKFDPYSIYYYIYIYIYVKLNAILGMGLRGPDLQQENV